MASPLIALFSPKGGVGTSLIAAGLSLHLARRSPEQVVLIDLDAGKADIAPLLQTSHRPSVLDLLPESGTPVNHPSGLRVLPGPVRLVDEPLVTGDLAARLLAAEAAQGRTVVADLSSSLRDATLIGLDQADVALLVTTPDLLSIYQARRFVQEAELIGLDLTKFRLVINRTGARQPIDESEIRELIGLAVAGRIPSLPGLAAAINQGMAFATMRSNTEFSHALRVLADNLAFAGVPPYGQRSPLDPRPAGLIPALKRWWQSR